MPKCNKCGSQVFLVDETITHLEIDGEIVKELGTGGLQNRNCLRCTHPEIYKDYKRLDEEAELFRQRRCCLNCVHFNEQDSTCPEGGFSEIENPYRTISSEDCSGFTAKGHGEAILSWKKGKYYSGPRISVVCENVIFIAREHNLASDNVSKS